VQVPLSRELSGVLELLQQETDAEVFVSTLAADATITVRARAADDVAAEQLERDLRVRVHERLRAAGVFA
jgi:hypothetical protein